MCAESTASCLTYARVGPGVCVSRLQMGSHRPYQARLLHGASLLRNMKIQNLLGACVLWNCEIQDGVSRLQMGNTVPNQAWLLGAQGASLLWNWKIQESVPGCLHTPRCALVHISPRPALSMDTISRAKCLREPSAHDQRRGMRQYLMCRSRKAHVRWLRKASRRMPWND